jgi:hypothetical protein
LSLIEIMLIQVMQEGPKPEGSGQWADRLSHDCVLQAETECRAMFGKQLVLQ